MSLVSVYIIAFNEAEKVRSTIESVRWADEIVLIDSWSTDGTADIAAALGARVVQVKFTGFGDLRNAALDACTHDWIFSLDADERCTPQAAAEIRAITADPQSLDAYWTPRRNYFMGRWIQHSGWYPNYRQPQLFRKGALRYDRQPVHEGFDLHTDKPLGHMQHAIWQFPFKNLGEVMHKANRYSTLGAEKIMHKKLSMGSLVAKILGAMATGVAKQGLGLLPDDMVKGIGSAFDKTAELGKDAVKTTTEAGKDAFAGIKGLFGGKKTESNK